MSRAPLVRTSEFPYHVHARANNKENFPCDLETTWRVFSKYLRIVTSDYDARILAFVLMSNHFHMLISTPSENLSEIMNVFLREGSRTLNSISGRQDHVFGGRYRWSLIETENYFINALRYVFSNPVRAGICERPRDYPYSSLRFLDVSEGKASFPIASWFDFSSGIPKGLNQFHQWLATPLSEKEADVMRRALRRRKFGYPAHVRFKKAVSSLSIQKAPGAFWMPIQERGVG